MNDDARQRKADEDIEAMWTARLHVIELSVFVVEQMRQGHLGIDEGRALLDKMLTIQNGLERGQYYARKYRKLARYE